MLGKHCPTCSSPRAQLLHAVSTYNSASAALHYLCPLKARRHSLLILRGPSHLLLLLPRLNTCARNGWCKGADHKRDAWPCPPVDPKQANVEMSNQIQMGMTGGCDLHEGAGHQ